MKKFYLFISLLALILIGIGLSHLITDEPQEPILSTIQPTKTVFIQTHKAVIHSTYTSTPYKTATPQPTATENPFNTPADRMLLIRLCISEAQGMQDKRQDACLSVIDTALMRTTMEYLGTGELYDTLAWGWNNSNKVFQFDPWLTLYCGPQNPQWFECNVNTEACNRLREQHCFKEYYDTWWAEESVDLYFQGIRGSCSGYLYYNSIIGGDKECIIESENGQFIEFFNK